MVPFTSGYDSFWVGVGAISLDLMAAVFVTSLLRSRLRPGTWRAVHWLAYLCWPVALAHTFGMGTDAGELWVIALGAVCVAAVLAALVWRVAAASRQTRSSLGPCLGRRGAREAPCARRARSGRSASWLASTRPWPLPGVTGSSVIRPISPVTLAALGPLPLPILARGAVAGGVRRPARGVRTDRSGRSWVPRGDQAGGRPVRRARGGTILVNAMEGEPASDKDKLLLIRSPHLVLDGAQLLAAATGAAQVMCLRARGTRAGGGGDRPCPGRAGCCGLGSGGRAVGATARSVRRRRGVGVGAVGRVGPLPPVVPTGQGDALAPRARAAS